MKYLRAFLMALVSIIDSHSKDRYPEDYIDWSKVPDEFEWVAVDSGMGEGRRQVSPGPCVGLYDRKPAALDGWWEAGARHGKWIDDASAIIGPLPPWRESLRRRPR